jgi:hypothetical protein
MKLPRMEKTGRILAALVLAAAAGCTTTGSSETPSYLIPDKTLNISPSLTPTVEGLLAGAIVFIVLDPLAPNWKIEQSQVAPALFELALTKKRFTTGGDGEAWQVFQRRAAQIARDKGSAGYRILEFSEGVESETLIARRVARGMVELAPSRPQ